MVSYNCCLLLLLYIITSLHAKLIGLTSQSALTALPYGLIFSYRNSTGSELYKDFVETSTNFVKLLCQNFANFNHLDFRCFKVDCNNIDDKVDEYVKESFCRERKSSKEEADFVKMSLFNSHDNIQLALEPQIALESRAYLRLLFKFFSSEWSNLHSWSTIDQFLDWATLEQNQGKRFFVCYGQPEHILGSTFCYQIAAMYRKNSEIGILLVESLESLAQLTMALHLKIDVNALPPMFGFWFLDCSSWKVGSCKSVKYLADDSVDRIHLFIKMLFMKNPVTMSKSGTIPDIGPVPGPLIFLIHKTVSNAKVEQLSQKLTKSLRGLAFIVLVNVDQLEVDVSGLDTLDDNDIRCKFRPRTVDDNGETVDEDIVDIDNLDHISDSVINWYKQRFDIYHLFDETKHKNLKFQNKGETVEALEDNILSELNPNINTDIKAYLIPLEPITFGNFVRSKSTALIVYWLNVDAASQATVYVVSQAIKILGSKNVAAGHVACHTWPELCKNVLQYPEIRIYNDGDYSLYNGIVEEYQISNRLIMLREPEVEEIFVVSNNETLKHYIIGCFKNGEMDLFYKLAKELRGQVIFKWMKDANCLHNDESKSNKLMIYNVEKSAFEPNELIIDQLTTLDRMKNFVIENLRQPKILFNAVNYIKIQKMYNKFYLVISPHGEKSELFTKLSANAEKATFVLDSSIEANLATKILKTKNLMLTDFDFLLRYEKPLLSILCSNCTHDGTKIGQWHDFQSTKVNNVKDEL